MNNAKKNYIYLKQFLLELSTTLVNTENLSYPCCSAKILFFSVLFAHTFLHEMNDRVQQCTIR